VCLRGVNPWPAIRRYAERRYMSYGRCRAVVPDTAHQDVVTGRASSWSLPRTCVRRRAFIESLLYHKTARRTSEVLISHGYVLLLVVILPRKP
jgi:hypothetical protein